MSILESCDLASEPLIRPEKMYRKIHNLPDICIVSFSGAVYKKVLKEYNAGETAKALISGGAVKIWLLQDPGVLFYLSPVGAAAAGAVLQDVHALTGAKHFIVFGSCGALDPSLQGNYLIPTEAYRDEGLSYHYCPPADFINIRNSNVVEEFFRRSGTGYAAGRAWSTDAVYMETRDKVQARRNAGCLCVDMECSGLQAVCDYLGIELYIFFFAGDILGAEWDPGDLRRGIEPLRQAGAFGMAMGLAESLAASLSLT